MKQWQFRLFPKKHGIFPFIWVVYMILPILNMQEYTGIKLAVGYAMMGLFAVTYRQLYWAQGRAFTAWLAVQMLIILLLSLLYNPQNVYLGFFTANFVSWYSDNRKFNIIYAIFVVQELFLVAWGLREMESTDSLFLLPFIIIMLISPFGIRSMFRRRHLEKELDEANEVIKELVKREERMRIARDLHDTLGHTLSLITLKSQLVEKLVSKDTQRAEAEAREIQRTSRAALRQVRELVSEMRAITVAEELTEAGEMLRTAEIALEIEGDVSLGEVSDLNQNILSLCIKEAVTNIVRHSGASKCVISTVKSDGQVRIIIRDNGHGLQSQVSSDAGFREGNGLKGMHERLSLIDGSLTISADGSKGTVLTVMIPLVVKERKDGETA
ncbi:sensor histidine kinase [Paenibacillus sp. GCM10012306]|uniref:sensor histidine kinase n=1 Tax=Paenibacillus sp. GCM10012306 TaxID=3317342 RepID=UPI00360A8E04